MKSLHKILGLVMICLSLSAIYSYADSVYGTMWKQEDTIVYPADDVTKIDFNNISGLNLLGAGGGVTEGSDVGFRNITAHRVKADKGVFSSLSSTDITTSNLKLLDGTETAPSLQVGDGINGFYSTLSSNFKITINSTELATVDAAGVHGWATGGPYVLYYEIASSINPVFAIFGDTDTGFGRSGANQPNIIAGATEIFRGYTSFTIMHPAKPGSVRVNGGVYTAFRNLSSATETLTSADYFINCLTNDNEVVITMPPVNASYSQTLMVKYTDSGSTNKCRLDGNGSEQVEGFDVYSGLTTYKDGAIFKSDGSAWWITGGI